MRFLPFVRDQGLLLNHTTGIQKSEYMRFPLCSTSWSIPETDTNDKTNHVIYEINFNCFPMHILRDICNNSHRPSSKSARWQWRPTLCNTPPMEALSESHQTYTSNLSDQMRLDLSADTWHTQTKMYIFIMYIFIMRQTRYTTDIRHHIELSR